VSRNERIRCVWALGWAFNHFGWMGDLTKRFWAKNGENPWLKHPKTYVSRRCAWGKAIGAHYQRASTRRCAPGALKETTSVLFCIRVLGGWRVGVLCTCLNMFFCCFQMIWNLEHILLGQNLDFSNGLKLEFVAFSVFRIYWKMNFFEQRGLHGWSTVHMDLGEAFEVGTKS